MARSSGAIPPGLRDLAISAITKESLAVPMTFPDSSEARICELLTPNDGTPGAGTCSTQFAVVSEWPASFSRIRSGESSGRTMASREMMKVCSSAYCPCKTA